MKRNTWLLAVALVATVALTPADADAQSKRWKHRDHSVPGYNGIRVYAGPSSVFRVNGVTIIQTRPNFGWPYGRPQGYSWPYGRPQGYNWPYGRSWNDRSGPAFKRRNWR